MSGGTGKQLRTFYTALYHALLMPNIISDVDGQYMGMDGQPHTTAPGHVQLSNISGWDIYRSEAQLLAMLRPDIASDLVRSLINDQQQSGHLPKWPVLDGQTNIMVGDPADAIIADAYVFGATDFDTGQAIEAMIAGASKPEGASANAGYVQRPGLEDFLNNGYIGYEENATSAESTLNPELVWGTASTTLEYQAADFGIARLAAETGDEGACEQFAPATAAWTHLWDPATKLIRPRYSNGQWPTDDAPASNNGFAEGSEAQYLWSVPNDITGLVNAMGGDAAAESRLNEFFTELNSGDQSTHAFLGNEPNLHVPYIYDWIGDPAAGAAVTRRAMLSLYSPTPKGYPGNDDGGEMASWWVLGALGVYPAVPSTPVLAIGAPLFQHAQISLPSGHTISIEAPGAGTEATTIESMDLNGAPYEKTWLNWNQLHEGASIKVTLSTARSSTWGTAAGDAPPSFPEQEACSSIPSN